MAASRGRSRKGVNFQPAGGRLTNFPFTDGLDGWLWAVAIGLTVMFFISGMFGIPAPLRWAPVIVFSFGAYLLDRRSSCCF